MLVARFTDSRLLAAFMAVMVHLWTGTLVGVALADESATDEPVEDVIEVEDIQIEAQVPESSLLFEDPTAVTERIEVDAVRDSVLDLPDLLQSATGLRVVSFGGTGRTATVSIRGSGGKQVLVLLDGVPLNLAGESFDLSTIPLDQLAAVEITRGGNSALYGGSAIGGVINLISRDGADGDGGNRGRVRFGVGSLRTTEGALLTSRTTADHTSLLQVQTQHTRGDFSFSNDNGTVFNSTDDFTDRRSNNEAHSAGLLWRETWKREGGKSLTWTTSGFWRTRGGPGIVTFPSEHSKLRESRLLFDVTYLANDWWWANSSTEVKAYGRMNQSVFQDALGEQTGVPLSTQQRSWLGGLRAGTSWSSEPEVIWTLLMEASEETQSNRGTTVSPATQRTSLGAALRGEWYLTDDWILLGAVRGDAISDQPNRLSPKVGVQYAASDEWTWRAHLGNSYRPPSFGELTENHGFVVGNPDLRPEVARTIDLSAAWEGDTGSASITGFVNDTRDLIEYVQIGGFRFKPLNFGRVRAIGVELAGETALSDTWTIAGDWTIQEVTDETGGANRQGVQIPGQPEQFGNLQLDYAEGAWVGTLTWTLVGSNNVTFANTKTLASRDTVDLALGYTAGPESWGLNIANLLDANVPDLRGFPLPGRTWLLTYTHDW